MNISIVIPVYKSEESLGELVERLEAVATEICKEYEILLVNDGSPGNDWDVIRKLAAENKSVVGVNLSRNFGQQNAIFAGLSVARGEHVVVMDCDLQDRPEEIFKLYKYASEGFDAVVAKRLERQDGWWRRTLSKYFFHVYSILAGVKVTQGIGNFGVYSRRLVDKLLEFSETTKTFSIMVMWSGFNRVEVDVSHSKRLYGVSSYNFRKMMSLAIASLIANSSLLLRIVVYVGMVLSCISFLYGTFIVVSHFFGADYLTGWSSVIASLYFLSGMIMLFVGLVGLYIDRIFIEVKGRPAFIIKEVTSGN